MKINDGRITISVDPRTLAALHALAEAMQREPDDLLHDALDSYLLTQQQQLTHVSNGLQQAIAGEFATDDEVAAAFERWQ